MTARADGTAQVVDVASGRAVGPPLRHAGAVSSAAFSPDGAQVLTASVDGAAPGLGCGRPVGLPHPFAASGPSMPPRSAPTAIGS